MCLVRFPFFIILFYNLLRVSLGNEDIVPAFIWTGSERQDSPHVVDDQIQSRIFESYMKKILSDKQPLLVVFLEEELSPDDFFWRNDNDESGYYPFLENLMQKDSKSGVGSGKERERERG